MQRRHAVFILLILMLNLALPLSKAWAADAVRCQQVFSESVLSQLPESLRKLSELFNLHQDLISFFKTSNTDNFNIQNFQTLRHEIEKATEAYFQSIGLHYEKKTYVSPYLQWQQNRLSMVEYDIFKINGVENPGDDNARLIDGFFKRSQRKIKLTYDPFLIFHLQRITAFFSPSQQRIEFTYLAFSDRIFGGVDDLRHEMQHAFEDEKVSQGRHSLARFRLMGPGDASIDPYARMLSLDELETHLRDLRGLRHISPRRIEALKEKGLSEAFTNSLQRQRPETYI